MIELHCLTKKNKNKNNELPFLAGYDNTQHLYFYVYITLLLISRNMLYIINYTYLIFTE